MSTRLPTLDELKDQLEVAEQAMAETNAAITSYPADGDEQTLADLNSRFDEEEKEVQAIVAAIDRHERMNKARQAVPREKAEKTEGTPRVSVNEPRTYRPLQEGGKHSFFKDLVLAKAAGDPGAQARLARHRAEMAWEFRNDMTTSATDGGEFVPPQHIQSMWAEYKRAGRVYANTIGSMPIPSTGTSFTIPKLTSGVSTAVQATENTAVSETDAVSDEITITVRTIAGQVDLSRQAFERSDPGLDLVLGRDLARSYNATLDAHLLNHASDGVLNNANVNAVTYTSGSPTVALLYPKIADAIQQIHTGVYEPPNAIFMHPRRWATFLAALDTTDRPLVTPTAPQNPIANFGGVVPEGAVGGLQGLPVYVDANIPTTLGTGTNEDAILVTWFGAHAFFETPVPRVRVFEEVGSGTLTVRLQVYGYIGYSSDRYGAGTSKITGTGLTTPSF